MTKVIISPGFGAGWSTWSLEDREFLTTDPGLVMLADIQAPADQAEEYIESTGREAPYMGGWEDVTVETVPKGYGFIVQEYDGHETLLVREEVPWTIA